MPDQRSFANSRRSVTVLVLSSAACVMAPAHSAVVVSGNTLSWPDDGWYQVQDASTYASLCGGGRSCTVPPGTYIVINHWSGQRYENVVVGADPKQPDDENPMATGISVNGLRISWPADGWYQVQEAATYNALCEGTRFCDVPAGTYNVINHTTGQRFEGIVAPAGDDPRPPQDDDPGNGGLPPPSVPELPDPFALPIPSPNPADPFGTRLEIDTEATVPGGPPTQPKNLRLDLVSNNWAEFNWAPSRDDGEVVQYNIYRSDGVTYVLREDQTDPASGSQEEIDKYWQTTSFIDCNFTRFDDRLHKCTINAPFPGQTYTYQVTAVDNEGQESAASEPLTITYLDNRNAPIPWYDDFYKMPDDRFVQQNDLSAVDYWIDDFDLVFSDEFNGNSIDPAKWQTRHTWGDSRIINSEQQYFVDTQANPDFGYDPFSFTGNSMIINAVPVPDELREKLPPVCDEEDPSGTDRCEFLSGVLSSHDRFQFMYGYTEGRFKLSGTPGALSSFYLYHRYPGSGLNYHASEIDIVEYLGENPFGAENAFQTYHYVDPITGITRSAPTMFHEKPGGGTYADNDEWHTFGVLWEPQLVIWYIDGREVKRLFGPQVSRQPMNIVSFLVAGSGWAPTPDVNNPSLFPLQFEVDYVRVYQREAFRGTGKFGG